MRLSPGTTRRPGTAVWTAMADWLDSAGYTRSFELGRADAPLAPSFPPVSLVPQCRGGARRPQRVLMLLRSCGIAGGRGQPAGDVGDDGGVHVLRRFVLRWRGRAGAGEEHVVVGVVDADGHVRAVGEAGPPSREVLGDSRLVVTAALQDEYRLAQRRGHRDWVVAAQVQPIGGRRAEGQVAGRRRRGQVGA